MLEALGNLGDFVGGIGVVVTLVYLAHQVRQNTVALKTASRQQIVAGMREHNRLAFTPGAEEYRRGLREFPDMPPDQSMRFTARMNDLVLFFQGVHALHEAGTLEDDTYVPYRDFVVATLATPGGRRYWERLGGVYTRRMASVIDEQLARTDLPDLLAFFPEDEVPTRTTS